MLQCCKTITGIVQLILGMSSWFQLLLGMMNFPRASMKALRISADNRKTHVFFDEVLATNASDESEVARGLPGCSSSESMPRCGCGVRSSTRRASVAPLPSLVIAGVAKAGTTFLVRLLEASSPAAQLAPEPVQMAGEVFYWVPEMIPCRQDEYAWRGWLCGDSTSFHASIKRLEKPECSAIGYRQAVWQYDHVEHHNRGFTLDKTPDYILWPHVHVALRQLVAEGTKIVVVLRSPVHRLWSHYRHFWAWYKYSYSPPESHEGVQDPVMGKILNPDYINRFGNKFDEYFIDRMRDMSSFLETLRHHLSTRNFMGAVEAYIHYIYSLCDGSDWVVSCALKRGVLQSLYLPQLLSLIRFVGQCPERWLRVVQSEQLYLQPELVLTQLYQWLGLEEGHFALNISEEIRLHKARVHRTSNYPPFLNEFHSIFLEWDDLLVEVLQQAGVILTPFDVRDWRPAWSDV